MPHLLDDIRAKIERADENITNLNAKIATFCNTYPHEIVRKFQKQGREYCWIVKGDPEIEPRFAVLVGEIIHHLRSSLDHLVAALVLRNKGQPTRRHGLPICANPEKFTEACGHRMIQGISASAAKLIEQEQPYFTSTPDDHFLTVLDDLNIRDKHSLLILVAAAAQIGNQITLGTDEEIAATLGLNPGRAIVAMGDPARVEITKEGVKVFSITLAEPDPTFKADANIEIQIAFKKCGRVNLAHVGNVLRGMRNATTALIGKFLGEFAPFPQGQQGASHTPPASGSHPPTT